MTGDRPSLAEVFRPSRCVLRAVRLKSYRQKVANPTGAPAHIYGWVCPDIRQLLAIEATGMLSNLVFYNGHKHTTQTPSKTLVWPLCSRRHFSKISLFQRPLNKTQKKRQNTYDTYETYVTPLISDLRDLLEWSKIDHSNKCRKWVINEVISDL